MNQDRDCGRASASQLLPQNDGRQEGGSWGAQGECVLTRLWTSPLLLLPFSSSEFYYGMFLLAKSVDYKSSSIVLYTKKNTAGQSGIFCFQQEGYKPNTTGKKKAGLTGKQQLFCQSHKDSKQLNKTPLSEVSFERAQI